MSVDSLSFLTWLRVIRWYLQGRLRRPSVRRRRPWWARRMTCLCRGRPLRNPAGGDIRRRAHLQQFAVKRGGGGCRREFALMAARARAGIGLGDTSASSARRSEFVVVRAHSCDQPHLSTNAHAHCKAIEEPRPGRRPEGWPDGSRCCAAATTAPMGAIRRVARGSLDEADYAAAGRSAPAMGLVRSSRAMELARAVNRRQSWVRGNPRGRRGASYALAIGGGGHGGFGASHDSAHALRSAQARQSVLRRRGFSLSPTSSSTSGRRWTRREVRWRPARRRPPRASGRCSDLENAQRGR